MGWGNESWGMEVCSNGPGHMNKMAAMPIYMYSKNLKNLLYRNQKADDLETWYAALSARVLPILLKRWPWADFDLFYGMVKFGSLCFCMGKSKTMDFSETIIVYDTKVGICSDLNKNMNYMNIKGQDHSLTFVQGHPDSTFSNFFSWETARPIEDKFQVYPPWDGRIKACSNGLCHMTKMAAMLIHVYGKNMNNSSPL